MDNKVSLFPKTERVINRFFESVLIKNCQLKDLGSADVVFMLIDSYAADLMEKEYYSFYKKKVIAYVLELNYKTIPLLKLADFIIYQDNKQKELSELVLGYTISCKILAFPVDNKMPIDKSCSNLVIYSDYLLEEEAIFRLINNRGHLYDNIYFVSSITNGYSGIKNVKCININELTIGQLPTEYKFVFFNDTHKRHDSSAKIKNHNKDAIYYSINGNLPVFLFQFLKQVSFALNSNEFCNEVKRSFDILNSMKKRYIEPDSLNDLNILSGSPLSNKFVFSVCYRNQQKKIFRSIKSICKQNNDIDFGVVVIDDASNDEVVEKIIILLEKYKIDHIVIKNKKRKFAARNLYNVIHHAAVNDESYIIELDGDDYLYTDQALNILKLSVDEGAVKTRGNFVVDNGIEIKHQMFEKEKKLIEFRYPRNISKCSGWYHLRMTRRDILRQIEIEHFLENNGVNWLTYTHDASVHSRAVEFAKDNMINIEKEIYVYDVSGDQHDTVELNYDLELDNWNYGSYLLEDEYLFKLFVPLFEEPRLIPSTKVGEGLKHNAFYLNS